MIRPALSATRALEFIDLMAATPQQAFTLSELAERTGTSVASCHAVLGALMQHGHLVRHPVHKTYRLGPALFGIGQTVYEHDPMIARARDAADALARSMGLEVLLTARAGDDIIALARVSRGPLPRISMRVGERAPLRPPLGAPFMAWSSEDDISAWLARGDEAAHADADRARLALMRARGFLVVLRSLPQDQMRSEIEAAGSPAVMERGELDAIMEQLYGGVYEPPVIEPDTDYPVSIISAPLFDAHGQVAYTITLGGFEGSISGSEIERLARDLLTACEDVMRESGGRRHVPQIRTKQKGRR